MKSKYRLETYITSQARLHKINEVVKYYITKIGVASHLEYTNQEIIIMPRGTWSIYAPKDDTYNFIGLFGMKLRYTDGDVAIYIGSTFSVKVGKISKDCIETNLPHAPVRHLS